MLNKDKLYTFSKALKLVKSITAIIKITIDTFFVCMQFSFIAFQISNTKNNMLFMMSNFFLKLLFLAPPRKRFTVPAICNSVQVG